MVDSVLSVEDLLSRSAAAVKSRTPAGGSAVQKLLAGRDTTEAVQLSDVQKLTKASDDAKKATSTPYTEQEWYLKAKVAQLKGQIELYSNLPGLDASGALMDQLTKEVNELVTKQQKQLKEAQKAAADKQAELDKIKNDPARFIPSADQLLQRTKDRLAGKEVGDFNPDAPKSGVSSDVQKLLDNAKAAAKKKGSTVNTTA